MSRRKLRRPVVALAAAVAVAGAGSAVALAAGAFDDNTPLATKTVGKQADGSYLTQTGQFVTPVGDVITEAGRPFGLALSPDGSTAAALNNGGATTGMVSVFDRTPAMIISPYAERGAVVHSYYSQLNMMRTIEQILGLPPMNQEDMTAEPMYDDFSNKPDLRPYTYLPNNVSLTETNPAPTASTSTLAAAWARWSAAQDWSTEDMVNMAQGNRDVWYSSNGFTKPYPGDRKVLLPSQVPGAGAPVKDADGDGH